MPDDISRIGYCDGSAKYPCKDCHVHNNFRAAQDKLDSIDKETVAFLQKHKHELRRTELLKYVDKLLRSMS